MCPARNRRKLGEAAVHEVGSAWLPAPKMPWGHSPLAEEFLGSLIRNWLLGSTVDQGGPGELALPPDSRPFLSRPLFFYLSCLTQPCS